MQHSGTLCCGLSIDAHYLYLVHHAIIYVYWHLDLSYYLPGVTHLPLVSPRARTSWWLPF